MDDIELLTYLADGLADLETRVRIDCAIAIDQLGRTEGTLLLRSPRAILATAADLARPATSAVALPGRFAVAGGGRISSFHHLARIGRACGERHYRPGNESFPFQDARANRGYGRTEGYARAERPS